MYFKGILSLRNLRDDARLIEALAHVRNLCKKDLLKLH